MMSPILFLDEETGCDKRAVKEVKDALAAEHVGG